MHLLRIAETHLRFGRVDVHVNLVRVHVDHYHRGGLLVRRHEPAVRLLDRMLQVAVLHRPAVDVHVLKFRRGPRQWRQTGKPPNSSPGSPAAFGRWRVDVLEFKQAFVDLAAEDVDAALPAILRAGGQFADAAAVPRADSRTETARSLRPAAASATSERAVLRRCAETSR